MSDTCPHCGDWVMMRDTFRHRCPDGIHGAAIDLRATYGCSGCGKSGLECDAEATCPNSAAQRAKRKQNNQGDKHG